MRGFVKSRVIEAMVAGCASYWFFAPFVDYGLLSTIINGILMALWIGLTAAYWHGTWIAVRDQENPLGGQIALAAVALLALAIVGIFSWGWAYQYLGQPEFMRNNIFRGWISWWFLVATVMLGIAGTVDKTSILPQESWRRVFVVAVMAVVLTLALVYTIGGFDPP